MDINKILYNDFFSYFKRVFLFLHPSQKLNESWHLECVCRFVEHSDKIVINLPPRTLKSIICTIAYSTWMIGKYRHKKIIIATYGEFLSEKFLSECKNVLNSEWYQELFEDFMIIKKTKKSIRNDQFGHIVTTSIKGALTGEGCDILIVDDPHKAIHAYYPHMMNKAIQWYENTLLSRLNNIETGKIIIIMQRIHKFDLTSYVLKKFKYFHSFIIPFYTKIDLCFQISQYTFSMKQNTYLYEHFNSLYTKFSVEIINSQYLQKPDSEENIFNIELIDLINHVNNNNIYQSWDTAISERDNNSYSVCTIWSVQNNIYVLIDIFKARVSYNDLLFYSLSFANKYINSTILVENKFIGYVLAEDLERNNIAVYRINPKVSKVQRALLINHLIKNIKILESLDLEKRNLFLNDLKNFPYLSSDDVVDSMTQFLHFITNNTANVF